MTQYKKLIKIIINYKIALKISIFSYKINKKQITKY